MSFHGQANPGTATERGLAKPSRRAVPNPSDMSALRYSELPPPIASLLSTNPIMKALLCRRFGPLEQLAVEDVPSLVAGEGQVVVTVKAAGVNFPDILLVQGKYQVRPALPFSPGGEFAGVVKNSVPGSPTCKPATPCSLRRSPAAALRRRRGSMPRRSSRSAPSTSRLQRLWSSLTDGAVRAHGPARLATGETLLVLGAGGGVGLAAVEIGKMLGAVVIAAASTDAKLDAARSRGADFTVNYERDDLKEAVRASTNGRGVDVVFDPVGGAITETALRATAWNGRLLVIGFASGEIPRILLNLPLLKGASIVGVFWGGFARREPARNVANTRTLIDAAAAGRIKPLVFARYPLARAVDALHALERRNVIGKLVVEPSSRRTHATPQAGASQAVDERSAQRAPRPYARSIACPALLLRARKPEPIESTNFAISIACCMPLKARACSIEFIVW